MDLTHLYPLLRAHLHKPDVRPTLHTLGRLKQRLPSPEFSDTLDIVHTQRLQTWLEVGRHLLDCEGGEFRAAFRDRRCLDLWKLVYDVHHHDLITVQLAEAYERMIQPYVSKSLYRGDDHRI